MRNRLGWLWMPIPWIWRGCFDWDAAFVCWCHAFLGRAPRVKPRRRITVIVLKPPIAR
jgi:hypothetical protein